LPYGLLLFLLVSALFSGTAAADLVSGGKAYETGDYDRAFKDFLELAKLGQPTAQFNVAAMYARGEGTRRRDIYAYAWATLPAENGVEKAKVLADSLRPKLALAPGSEQIAADIEAPYGQAVKSENKAIAEAQHLKWDLAPLNERLTRYTENQPWYGPLLEF
jgi:hypothetical protein